MIFSFTNMCWEDIVLAHNILEKGKVWEQNETCDIYYYGGVFYRLDWDEHDSICAVEIL